MLLDLHSMTDNLLLSAIYWSKFKTSMRNFLYTSCENLFKASKASVESHLISIRRITKSDTFWHAISQIYLFISSILGITKWKSRQKREREEIKKYKKSFFLKYLRILRIWKKRRGRMTGKYDKMRHAFS